MSAPAPKPTAMEAGAGTSSPQTLDRENAEVEFSRIVAFSDGVFAIAITLLVLALDIPSNVDDLGEELSNQVGNLAAYGISFAVLGRIWLSHHRFFGSLARFDSTLMGLNLLYLAFIALIPFTSKVLGEYGNESLGVITWALSMVAVSASFHVQTSYAYRRDLLKPWARAERGRRHWSADYLTLIVFSLSIPVAVVSPTVATVMWAAIFFFGHPTVDRVARRLGGDGRG